MKRFVILLLCLCLSFSLFATTSYFNFGVGSSVAGRSDAVSVVSINVVYIPFDFDYCNPYLNLWTSVSWDGKKDFTYEYAGFGLSLELGRFKFNPLQFASNNPCPWTPSVTVGMVYNKLDKEEKLTAKLYVEASIFRISDKDYTYEWFSPFVVINKNAKLWGVTVFRFTPLYHIGKEVRI